jgi:hypothetical protein
VLSAKKILSPSSPVFFKRDSPFVSGTERLQFLNQMGELGPEALLCISQHHIRNKAITIITHVTALIPAYKYAFEAFTK